MFKGVTIALYSGLLLLFSFLGGDAITLDMEVEAEVEAGQRFDVSVTVDKGDLESFARFNAALPRGLKAVSGSAENANFRFEDQEVKFIWLRLPHSRKFKLTYTVEIDPRLRGSFDLGGEIAYIVDNTRKSTMLKPKKITIKPSPSISPAQQLDLDSYQRSIPAQRDVDIRKSRVRALRLKPRPMDDGDHMEVKLYVNRGEASKFARIEEKLPAGYSAEPIDTKDAIFSFEDGKAKFLWMELPPDPTFSVSYRLIPLAGPSIKVPEIEGTFSFVHNDATRTITVIERNLDVNNLSQQDLESVVKGIPAEIVVVNTSGAGIEPQGASSGGVDIPIAYREIEKIPSTASASARSKQPRTKGKSHSSYNIEKHMLSPEKGVIYRVQVAAGHRPVNVNRYFKRLKLNAHVTVERHDGWYKYSVGAFKVYKNARDYRDEIWRTTPITDAFVAAYNDGKRITVQEALMITSQKWYK